MPILLGNTYIKSKALPNVSLNCLIPTMHIGEKLKQEAERLGLKPKQIAEMFGVKPPSVYDWYEHGRIHKKHYPAMVAMSGKSIEWWLDISKKKDFTGEEVPSCNEADHRHKILLDLFDALPSSEQEDLIRTLTEKKQHYDALIDELLSRRSAA